MFIGKWNKSVILTYIGLGFGIILVTKLMSYLLNNKKNTNLIIFSLTAG